LKDSTEQGPVDGPSLDGFGMVGAVAVDAFLADMQLPASEIGWCGFHGFGVWLSVGNRFGFFLQMFTFSKLSIDVWIESQNSHL